MGLERAAAVLQGKPNVYETDLFLPIVQRVCELSAKTYGQDVETDYAIRVVAEHARAACFLIGDGVVTGNDGRGYVLRRVIRRGIRYGKRLGLDQPFMTEVARVVLERFQETYGELLENHAFILRVVGLEEERFGQTIQTGLGLLEQEMIPQAVGPAGNGGVGAISGLQVFILYDTYGFPPELTAEIAREHGLEVDLEGFEQEMEAQRQRARAAQAFTGAMEVLTTYENLGVGHTHFMGYQELRQDTVLVGILVDNQPVGHATRGQQVELVLQETPFYAEGGGQLGDHGEIAGPNGLARVEDTQSPVAGLIVHRGMIEQGDLSLGEPVTARVDAIRRLDSARNHSGTHLLHAALRSVLGVHVRQAGSLVAPERFRFDFSHVSPLAPDEQLSVQSLANQKIRDNLQVTAQETTYADAVRQGALAFFGDRYGDVVRMVEMSDGTPFSLEVCSGTHVSATGQVGTLFVLGESSIGGGMRRIEGVTGRAAEQLLVDQSAKLEALSRKLQTPVADLEARLDSFIQDNEELRRRLTALERTALRAEAEGLLGRVMEVQGVNLVVGRTSATSPEAMREMGDFLKAKLSSVALVLGAVIDGSPILVSMVTADLVDRGLHAGNIARDVAKVMGGGGGGRPEMAQAGGRHAGKLEEALQGVPDVVRQALG
jgi:alanyl-tRNA synthetase